MATTDERADFHCRKCKSLLLYRVVGTDGTYQCESCGFKTHAKIEDQRDDLKDLAESDNPASRVAATLLGCEEL